MESRDMMLFKNTLIRGTIGMLEDHRMERQDEAYQYLMDVTNAATEDDIRPLLRGKSATELIEINKKIGEFLTPRFFYSDESSLTPEAYKEYGKYKGD
jgi:hypothetical protein